MKAISKTADAEKPKSTPRRKKRSLPGPGLGDRVGQALALVGITEERVSKWLRRPCRCKERKERLNQLGRWARRVLSGRREKAEEYLNAIIGEEGEGGESLK